MSIPLSEGVLIADRYLLGRVLGRGGMGIVHLAYDRELGQNVAIKMVAPDRSGEPVDLRRFQLEARALAAIRSPNVIALHAFGRSRETCYYVMDYIEGATVDQLVARNGGRLDLERVLRTLRDVGFGLDDLHHAGFIHRDIKPSNILVEERTGRGVVFDLGLVFRWRNSCGRHTGAVGSPMYMAPEQGAETTEVGVNAIGPWTDEYALACTAFEMLAGQPPFDRGSVGELLRCHVLAPPPPLSSHRPDLAALDPVFARALAKAPEDRYESASAMVAAIVNALRPRGLLARVRALLPAAGRPELTELRDHP